jgi:hypothetical protein
VFVHVLVTLVIVYLAISALVTLDNAFKPAVATAGLTLSQVNDFENRVLSNPITAAMVSKSDLDALKKAAAQSNAAHIDSIAGIHQLEQIYTSFLQPQLHGSHIVPFILGFGAHIPLIGHVGPSDLQPLPTPSPTACPTPTPKATATPKTTPKVSAKPTASPKTTPTPRTTPAPVVCPTPSPTK